MNSTSDDLIFLLSTDWFMRARALCGFTSESAAWMRLQEKCRGIVNDLLGESGSYWDVEMSEVRLTQTAANFLTLIRTSTLSDHDKGVLSRFSQGESAFHDSGESLTVNLLYVLVGEADHSFPKHVIQAISTALETSYSGEDIAGMAGSVDSEWDSDLDGRREGVTEYLVVVAKGLATASDQGGKIWARLQAKLAESELTAVASWLNARAVELVGENVVKIRK